MIPWPYSQSYGFLGEEKAYGGNGPYWAGTQRFMSKKSPPPKLGVGTLDQSKIIQRIAKTAAASVSHSPGPNLATSSSRWGGG